MATVDGKQQGLVPTHKEDFLDQDPDIRGQKYVCLSFLSPEQVLMSKDTFFLSKFLVHLRDDVLLLLNNIRDKFADQREIVDMVRNITERYEYLQKPEALHEQFGLFKGQNSEALESEFYEKNNFQTSMRGIKVRGSYESLKEAQMRAEAIKRFDSKFDVYVAQVGCWCPWSPYSGEIQDQEYAEAQLNTLMKKYKENVTLQAETYEQRKQWMVEQNKKQALEEEGADGAAAAEEAAAGAADDSTNQRLMEGEDPWLARRGQS